MTALATHARTLALALALGSALAACGSPDAETSDAGLLYSCAMETRAVKYEAGLTRTSVSGAFQAVLVSSDPGPPVRGSNTWTVRILESDGVTPADGITVTALPYMPDHRHPTTVKPVITPANDGTGTYTLAPVYLYMPGYWEVTLTVQPASGPKDTIVFAVCISS